MYKILLFFSFNLSICILNAQNNFEKGYFINNKNEKIICLIKNKGWKNTPQSFIYKLNENSENKILDKTEAKEVGFNSKLKFVRINTEIDVSIDKSSRVSNQQREILKKDTLFTQLLVSGESNLFYYQGGKNNRFFFSINDEDPLQLIYKQYFLDGKIGYNKRFQQQLKNTLNCTGFRANFSKLSYNKRELISVFEKYNECIGSDFFTYKQKKPKAVSLGLRLEVMSENFQIYNPTANFIGQGTFLGITSKFENQILFQYGTFIEYNIPYFNNKWSFRIEPSYQKLSKENEDLSFKYSSIEVPIGVRFYYYKLSKHKFHIDCLWLADISPKAEAIFENGRDLYSEKTLGDFALGMGYSFDRLCIDLRYKFGKDLLGSYLKSRTVFRGVAGSISLQIY